MRVLAILAVALTLTAAAFMATSASAGEKGTICHATGSESNPYVEITIARQAWESGHSPHAVHVGDYIGKCEVLTSSIVVTPTPTHNTHNTHEPVASSISQDPEPTPTPSLPMEFPASGG